MTADTLPLSLVHVFLLTAWTLAACSPSGRPERELRDPPRHAVDTLTHAADALRHADTLQLEVIHSTTFADARAVAADPLGFIYVADAGRHVVVKLSARGAVESVIGGPGSREGEFDEPSGVEATNGLVLFVADANNRRIQRFSRSNAYLGSIPLVHDGRANPDSRVTYRRGEGDLNGFSTGRPISVVSSDSKEVYAIDADRNIVLNWNEDLRLAAVRGDVEAGPGTLAEPVDIAMGARSMVYVADRGRSAVVVFDQYGSYVRAFGEGRLSDLRSVVVGEGTVFAGHSNHISLYTTSGMFLGSMALNLNEPLVDLAITNDAMLLVVTPTRLLRAPIPVPPEP